MNEKIGNDHLQLRHEMLQAKLGAVVGLVHPRLSDPAKQFSKADLLAARLTYGEILSHDPEGESRDLIPGAIRVDDEKATLTLTEGHVARVEGFLLTSVPGDIPKELAGFHVRELPELAEFFGIDPESALHPYVEGCSWYRGLFMATNEAEGVLLLMPYMRPSAVQGSPAPIMYYIGSPDIATVRSIATAFSDFERATDQAAV